MRLIVGGQNNGGTMTQCLKQFQDRNIKADCGNCEMLTAWAKTDFLLHRLKIGNQRRMLDDDPFWSTCRSRRK